MKILFFFAGFLFFVFPAAAQITDTGNNVGIGTTSPSFKLHVQSIGEGGILAKSSSNGTYGASNIIVDAATNFPARFIFRENGVNKGWIDYFSNNINIRNGANQPFFTVKTDNGYVGIGTTNPKTKLHIFNGVSNGNTHVFSDLTVEDDDHAMLSLLTPNNKTAYYGFADQDDEYVAGIQYEHSIDRMVFRVNNHTSDMTIINNGNVGIGTASPDSKLTVAGNIHSREVKVTVNAGADFVFEDNYNLPTLEEVQEFIQENGHLPEIAPAKDMEENGINLSEMNIKLLQKIEELTLYAIEQEKKIKILEDKLEKVDELEKSLIELINKK